jgi:hypothetical protein
MKLSKLFDEMKALADQLGIRIRTETGNFSGGYCLLHSQKLIVINKHITVETKIAIIGRALAECDIDTMFLKPMVREVIEKERNRNHTIIELAPKQEETPTLS